MSSFTMKVRDKKTGGVHEVFCHDDYFGRHEYGYTIDGKTYLNEKTFSNQYERVEDATR